MDKALNLPITHTIDWFVELHLNDSAHLSIADASRTSIPPGHGAGVTLSWQVHDIRSAHEGLVRAGVGVSTIATRWSTEYLEFHDPEGNRIELWSQTLLAGSHRQESNLADS